MSCGQNLYSAFFFDGIRYAGNVDWKTPTTAFLEVRRTVADPTASPRERPKTVPSAPSTKSRIRSRWET